MRRGYRRVRADFAPFAADLCPEDEAQAAPGFDRATLLDALRGYFTHRGFDANWDAINQMPDLALVTTLCMVCPFEAAEKQALLEADEATDRAQVLLALLRIDAHEAADETDTPRNRSQAS
jgi:Lon protease-like protein